MTRRGFGARVMTAFDTWFASSAGVWQTLAVTLAVVVVEQVFPHLDPNHFIVLYVLTVYSGITQPALAHVGAESAQRQELILAKLDRLMAHLGEVADEDIVDVREELAILHEMADQFTAFGDRLAALEKQSGADL